VKALPSTVDWFAKQLAECTGTLEKEETAQEIAEKQAAVEEAQRLERMKIRAADDPLLLEHWYRGKFRMPRAVCFICNKKILRIFHKGGKGRKCMNCKAAVHDDCIDELRFAVLLHVACPSCGPHKKTDKFAWFDSFILKWYMLAHEKLSNWQPSGQEMQQASVMEQAQTICKIDVDAFWTFYNTNGEFAIENCRDFLRDFMTHCLKNLDVSVFACIRDFIALRGYYRATNEAHGEQGETLRVNVLKQCTIVVEAALARVNVLSSQWLKGMDMDGQGGCEEMEFKNFFWTSLPPIVNGHSLNPAY